MGNAELPPGERSVAPCRSLVMVPPLVFGMRGSWVRSRRCLASKGG